MKYKVGDKVFVDPKANQKSWIDACSFVPRMKEHLGQIVKITQVNDDYNVPIYFANGWWWVESVLHPVSRTQDFTPIDIFKCKQ